MRPASLPAVAHPRAPESPRSRCARVARPSASTTRDREARSESRSVAVRLTVQQCVNRQTRRSAAQRVKIDFREIDQQLGRLAGMSRAALQARRDIRPARLSAWADTRGAENCGRSVDPCSMDLPPSEASRSARIARYRSVDIQQRTTSHPGPKRRIAPIPATPAGPLPRMRFSNSVSA